MKKNDQQRLILNIIILVISAFILIFMLLGKFLSPSDPVSSTQEVYYEKHYVLNELNRKSKGA